MPDPTARIPVRDAARTPRWPIPYRVFLHGSGRYPEMAQTARTCIYGHLDEGNADNPEVSHLETDDNLPGREHGLG